MNIGPPNYRSSGAPEHLRLLNPYIGLKFLSSLRSYNFFPKFPDGDKYNHRYMSPRGWKKTLLHVHFLQKM